MKTSHTFSILAYKKSEHLQECIDSLKNQKLSSEIVICTSTPSDFLEDIAKKNNLQLFVNPMKNGIASDWNFALQKTESKYITLAHQDDIYLHDYSKEIIKSAEAHQDALIIFSNYNELIKKNKAFHVREKSLNFLIKNIINGLFFKNKNYKRKNKKRLLSLGNPIGCPTVTFNKNNVGNFRFDQDFSINMDWKAWIDLAQKEGCFVWVKKTLVSHRIYAGSETTLGIADNRRQEEDRKIFKMTWPTPIAIILSKLYSHSYENNNN